MKNALNMKNVLSISVLFIAVTSWAQAGTSQKLLTRIVFNDTCRVLEYSGDGLLSSIYERAEEKDSLLWRYRYHSTYYDGTPFVYQGAYLDPSYYYGDTIRFFNREESYFRDSLLSNDSLIIRDINQNSCFWSTGLTNVYEYDNGRMVEMKCAEEKETTKLFWIDGNLSSITFYRNDEMVGNISCRYNNMPAKGVCQAFNSPLMLLLDYYFVQSLGPLWNGYYGLLNENLLSEVIISFSEDFIKEHCCFGFYDDDNNYHHTGGILAPTYYPIVERKSRTYSYETDAEGYVTKMTVNEGGNVKQYLMYYETEGTPVQPETCPVAIKHIYYDLQGRRLDNAPVRHGLYIKDGRKHATH